MMSACKFLAFAITLLAFSVVAAAQSPSALLKRAEKALGGEKAVRAAVWSVSGTISSDTEEGKGSFTASSDGKGRYREVIEINGFERESAFNGRSAWKRDSRSGLRTLTGEESDLLQAIADYRTNLWFSAGKRKLRITYAGQAADCDAVAISSPKGVTIKVCFDRSSGLIRREEFTAGAESRRFEYSDFRPAGTGSRPFRIDVTSGDEKIQIAVSEYKASVTGVDFNYPQTDSQPLPDLRALLDKVAENQDYLEKTLENYSFEQKVVSREVGKDGKLREKESETRQISYYKGVAIPRLIEKNGKPLDAKAQAEVDKDVAKKIEELDKSAAREGSVGKKGGPPSEERISISELLRASNLINPRRERFRGRSVIVFDFEPNPAFDYRNSRSFLKFFGKTAGVIWIDESDRQVARIEAFLVDSFNIGGGLVAKLKKGASFTLEQERVNDEIWLPSLTEIDLSARVLLFKGFNVNQTIRSYNYRRFRTEVRDAEVREPATKP